MVLGKRYYFGGNTMSFLKVAAVAVAVSGGILAFAPAEAQAQGYGYYGQGYGHHYASQHQYVHPRVAHRIARHQARLARQQAWEQHYYAQQHYGRPSHYGYSYHQPRAQSFSYSFGW
jgi:hypothetical protein